MNYQQEDPRKINNGVLSHLFSFKVRSSHQTNQTLNRSDTLKTSTLRKSTEQSKRKSPQHSNYQLLRLEIAPDLERSVSRSGNQAPPVDRWRQSLPKTWRAVTKPMKQRLMTSTTVGVIFKPGASSVQNLSMLLPAPEPPPVAIPPELELPPPTGRRRRIPAVAAAEPRGATTPGREVVEDDVAWD